MTIAASQERHVQLCKEYWIAGHSPTNRGIYTSIFVGIKIKTRYGNGIQNHNMVYGLIDFTGHFSPQLTVYWLMNVALYNHHLAGAASVNVGYLPKPLINCEESNQS